MIDGYKMWVTEGAYPMRLGAEPIGIFSVVGQMCCQHLNGNLTLQEQVRSPIDLGHPTHAYQLTQLVVAQALPA
jgi:hypothetical protein